MQWLAEKMGLTDVEQALMQLRAAGFTSKQIISRTGLAESDVEALEAAVSAKVAAYQETLTQPSQEPSEAEAVFHEGRHVVRAGQAKRPRR
jgi:transcriptional regulator